MLPVKGDVRPFLTPRVSLMDWQLHLLTHFHMQVPRTPHQHRKAMQVAPQQQQQQQHAALQLLLRPVRIACLTLLHPATAWV